MTGGREQDSIKRYIGFKKKKHNTQTNMKLMIFCFSLKNPTSWVYVMKFPLV